MDKNRYSLIAHGELPVWNPIAVSHLKQYVSLFALPANSTVLDIGCGRGNVLNLILSQHPVQPIGVDLSTYAMAEAARDLAAFIAAGRLFSSSEHLIFATMTQQHLLLSSVLVRHMPQEALRKRCESRSGC